MTDHIEDPREVRTSWAGGVPDFIVVMGVAGTGKTEIARRLADVLGAPFVEADALHSSANVERMRLGIGLTDEDRWPWLNAACEAALAMAERRLRGRAGRAAPAGGHCLFGSQTKLSRTVPAATRRGAHPFPAGSDGPGR